MMDQTVHDLVTSATALQGTQPGKVILALKPGDEQGILGQGDASRPHSEKQPSLNLDRGRRRII